MKTKLLGRKVYITDKESIYCGEWGIVDDYDGDVYYIRIADGSSAHYSVPVFERSQFKVPRIK